MVYITRRKKKGKYYLYLEESARIDGKPRRVWQKYLGPEERLKDLTLSGLFAKQANQIKIETFEFGISSALWQISEKIGLAGIIDKNTNKKREQGLTVGEYISIAAINRCCMPCSKSKLGNWFKHDWLSTQYDINPEILNAQTYWNHFQYLEEETLEKIEIELNKIVINKFELDLDSLFYDPTNFFTFSKGTGDDGLLQFGHSKENRNGNRIVSYTLLCARESGVPLMHKTYAGNEQDAKRFKAAPKEIQERLQALNRDPTNVTLVFDKGNHSKEAFQAIDEYDFGFIASARNSTLKDLLHISIEKMTDITLPITGKTVKYVKLIREIYEKKRIVYVVFDPKKNKKHSYHFNEQIAEKIQSINDYFKTRLNIKKWRNKEAVEKKLKSMIGRRPFKDIIEYHLKGSDAKLSLTLSINKKAKEGYLKTLGRTILFTNRDSWTPEAIIWGYREQYIVEHAFRKMKSPTSIKIRPMYHYSDRSIRVHVYICILSLLLLSLLRLTLSRYGFLLSYDKILEHLSSVHVLKIMATPRAKALWKLDKVEDIALKLEKKLKLKALI
ncbi:MAG: IS1634 family transposase [Promethearchaeota archaeon]